MIDFSETITKWRDGALVIELNETLMGVIKACIETGKAGEIKLIFKLEPYNSKDGGWQINLTPKVESKNPRFDPGTGIFHVVTDQSGNPVGLEREDPRQSRLFEAVRTE